MTSLRGSGLHSRGWQDSVGVPSTPSRYGGHGSSPSHGPSPYGGPASLHAPRSAPAASAQGSGVAASIPGQQQDEVQCLTAIVQALHAILDESIALTRDTETEAAELLELAVEVFRAAGAALEGGGGAGGPGPGGSPTPGGGGGAMSILNGGGFPGSAAPFAGRERAAHRLGTLLYHCGPLAAIGRFLPTRLAISAKMRLAVVKALHSILSTAALVDADTPAGDRRPEGSLVASAVFDAFRVSTAARGPGNLAMGGGGGAAGGGAGDSDLCKSLHLLACDDAGALTEAVRATAAETLVLAHSAWPFLVLASLVPMLANAGGDNASPGSQQQQHLRGQGAEMGLPKRLGALLQFALDDTPSTAPRLRVSLCTLVRLIAEHDPQLLLMHAGRTLSPVHRMLAYLDPLSKASEPIFAMLASLAARVGAHPRGKGAAPADGAGEYALTPTQYAAMQRNIRCYVLVLGALTDVLAASADHHTTQETSAYWTEIALQPAAAAIFARVVDRCTGFHTRYTRDLPADLSPLVACQAQASPGAMGLGSSEAADVVKAGLTDEVIFAAAVNLAKTALLLEGQRQERLLDGARSPLPVFALMAVSPNQTPTKSWAVVLARASDLLYFPPSWHEHRLHALQLNGGDATATAAAGYDPVASHRGLERLRLLRFAIAHAFTHDTIQLLEDAFLACFQSLCQAISLAQERLRDSPEHKQQAVARDLVPDLHGRESEVALFTNAVIGAWDAHLEAITVEASLILGLMVAKSPRVRASVQQLVAGYSSWALNMHAVVESVIAHPKVLYAALQHLVLVDAHQCILNDGEQAQYVDRFDEKRIAVAIIREQAKRFLLSEAAKAQAAAGAGAGAGAGDAAEASCFPLDLETIHFFLTQHSDDPHRRYTPRIMELSYRLAREVLLAAVTAALIEPPRGDEDAGADADPANSGPAGDGRWGRRGAAAGKNRRFDLLSQDRPMKTNYDRWLAQQEGQQQQRGAAITHAVVAAMLPKHKKEPFRPTSTAKKRALTPTLGSMAPVRKSHAPPKPNAAEPAIAFGLPPGSSSVQEVMTRSATAVDTAEYLSIAIMMHLPVKYGVHYQRAQKAAVRHLRGPDGTSYVQPVHRNTTQSWSARDVFIGEVYVLFLPFHRITLERLNEEIGSVQRFVVDIRKKLTTTPVTQRSRRWFLTDMLNYILPKTEILLTSFRDLVDRYSAGDVVYHMGIVRMTDEATRQREKIFEAAVEDADVAMPREVLRLSGGRFKDVLHSGNLMYAVAQLRSLYERKERGEDTAFFDPGEDAPSTTRLRDIERQIERLRYEDGDDVESIFDDEMQLGVPDLSPAGGGLGRDDDSESGVFVDAYDPRNFTAETTKANLDDDGDDGEKRSRPNNIDSIDLRSFVTSAYDRH